VDEPINKSDTAESIDLDNKIAEGRQGKEKTEAHDAWTFLSLALCLAR
jgi:hypothetical protein